MLSACKNYIDFVLNSKNKHNNNWKEYLRFFIGFATATIVVDFIFEFDLWTGTFVFLFILLLFEFMWINILFILRDKNDLNEK